MIRNDFVSNSSSSSFIVAAEDNKFDILLHDYDILTLDEYIDHFIIREIFDGFYYLEKMDSYKFVSDAAFNKNFGIRMRHILPEECKPLVEKLIELRNDTKNNSEESFKIYDKIKEICKKVLQLKWKDVKFHYAEVDDNTLYDEDRDDGVMNEEELTEEKINYFASIKPLKFYKMFCNH